jgi:hypothetical protein
VLSVTEEEVRQLDKSWAKHRKKNRLDAYGRKAGTGS